MTSLWISFSLVGLYYYDICQIDIIIIFLNGTLQEESIFPHLRVLCQLEMKQNCVTQIPLWP
jgi:hypothetical protein